MVPRYLFSRPSRKTNLLSFIFNNLYPKDMLRLTGPSAKVVAGGLLTDPYRDEVSYKKYRPELQFLVVPGFGKVEHQFLVEGRGEITVKYESRHVGKLAKTAVLK